MKKVLVCGLIGSGKSEVCKRIAECGFPVYDCDTRAKALYTPEVVERIEEAVGEPIGEQVLFSDNKRRTLQAILYPLVRADLEVWSAVQNSEVVFVESATAHDAPEFEGFFDEVLEVTAPSVIRAARNPKAESRSALQTRPLGPDFIIDNDGTLEELRAKTDFYLKQYENRSF